MSLKGKNVRVRGQWWHYQFEASGRMHSGNTDLAGVSSNQSAAEAFAERKRLEALGKSPETERRMPFDQAAGEFSAWARNIEYRGRPNTAARLKTSMHSCAEYFGDRPVVEIGPAQLEGYKRFRVEEHGVRDITLRHDLHALSVFFRYAQKMGWAGSNPVKEVKIPSDRDAVREHVISPEEEGVYLRTALALYSVWAKGRERTQPNMHDLALLMLETGARPEELLAARAEDFDSGAGVLNIRGGKTRAAGRALNLTHRAAAVVERRAAVGGPWLFPSCLRPAHHVTKLQATHDRVCREAGLCFVIYDCRHTWATRAIAAGIDVPTAAAIMGHSGLRTIYRYVHPTAEAKKLAMERFEAAATRRQIKVVGK